MQKITKLLFVAGLIFCGVVLCNNNALAEDFYIGFEQSGDGSGDSCLNAKSYLFYNTGTNCGDGVGKISSGDHVKLCDDTGEFTSTLSTQFYCNNFTLEAAEGETPVLNVVSGNALNFPNTGKANIIIDGLTFAGWADGVSAIYFVNAVGPIEIRNSKFTKSNATAYSYGINFFVSNAETGAVHDVAIYDNEFALNSKVEAIRFSIFTSTASSAIYNVNIHNNDFNDVSKAARFYLDDIAKENILGNGFRPYNIKFDDNVVNKTYSDTFACQAGIAENGGTSSVSRNHITDCGSPLQERVNCLQLHWVDGVDINDNVIDDVDTATCDGDAIILDFANSDDAYVSTNNNVLRNRISNTNAVCGGTCISVYKGSGNFIAENLCDNATSTAYKVSNNESAGNIFYNNTAIDVVNCFALSDGDDIGVPESIWKNNICSHATGHGFRVVDNSVFPTESHNLFYDVISNDIMLDATDLTADPKLLPDGTLELGSPAIDTGIDVGLPYLGSAPDIGAFEYSSIQPPVLTYTLTNFISAITNWLQIGNTESDVNSDGVVNTRDLGVMMSGWGE
ncbi:MAG: hypothetical protein M0P97_02110 [Candidatus Moranbacteria bacterium]|jgi:hypothetical protein|nr:hypothetical protein [Candidatus Moranbacteria bacterium]